MSPTCTMTMPSNISAAAMARFSASSLSSMKIVWCERRTLIPSIRSPFWRPISPASSTRAQRMSE